MRPLTDGQHAEHVAEVRQRLAEARAAGLATCVRHTIDRAGEVWSEARELQHNGILQARYVRAQGVPCERLAVLAGGLPGSGKTTVLHEQTGFDLSRYLVINPDEIKEELARRRMVPEIRGLSPMEAAELVHEESSHLAKRLAQRAVSDGKNVVWDITMSSGARTERRIESLRSAGYVHVAGLFVDISVPLSVRRADDRYRREHEDYRNGMGLGGRFVAAELIRAQSDETWGSENRRSFETLRPKFSAWSIYDNSVADRPPRLVAASAWDRYDGQGG